MLKILLLLVFWTSFASASPTPLSPVKDPVGEALQETFIAPTEPKSETNFVAFRKNFALSATRQPVMLHLFADVRYLAWINGQFILRGPARFEPTGPEYDSLDISKFLKPGNNQITVLVMSNASNGKMRQHVGGLTARIESGGRPLVTTDATWKWSDQTRYRKPNVNWGNTLDRIDAQVEDGDWTQPSYKDISWKTASKISGEAWGPLTARRIPLLRDTPAPVTFPDGRALPITLQAGEKLPIKTGRLVQAYTVIELDADAGTELSLDYAGIQYIARAGRQTYISSDTHGIADGSITVKSGRATITSFQLVERLYPFDVAGSFQSNDAMLNRLWAVCTRSCQIFSEDSYVDCADRERTEWMDDDPPGFDVTRIAMTSPGPDGKPVFADARLLEEMLRRTALSVQPDGWVKAHTCSDRFDIHARMEDRGCDWVEGARRYYESTGNPAVIKEIWPVIVRQMDYFLKLRTERGLVLAREWVVWGNPVGYVTCEGAGLNAFVYKALVDAAYLGNAIGEKQQAAKFEAASKDLAEAFNKVLWNEKEGTYYSGYTDDYAKAKAESERFLKRPVSVPIEGNLIEPTMFPALWALDQGIVPEDRKSRVTQYLLANRAQAKRIMTFYYLFKQLYQADTPEFDREMLDTLRTQWKAMSESGWQTTWEEFNGASKAHIYGMFPGYFLSAYVLGVRPDLPASNRRILIEPHLGDLTSAEGNVVTEFGVVPVSWKSHSGKLDFQFNLPAGVKGVLRLPAGKLLLDGKAVAGKADGTRFVTEVGPGQHQGSLTPLATTTSL